MHCLSKQELDYYSKSGYLAPIRVMSEADMNEMRLKTERLGAARGGQLPPSLNMKAHLLIPWLWDLVCDPNVIGPVKDILGDDVLCWASSFFDKQSGTPNHVPWHQDSSYWGLERPDALTAWIAFTPSNIENGCLRLLPCTHGGQLKHVCTGDPNNMLLGNEALSQSVAEEDAVDIVLKPGEMSLHHLRLIHGSNPNSGSQRRTGFAIRYIAGTLRGSTGLRGYATLVSGKDHGGFILEQKPEGVMHRNDLKRYAVILNRCNAIIQAEIRADRAPKGGS
ncbi:MAG: phytanoyl-CoA dioxygenase family protein [Gammaproteobacteria bacterium]